MTIAVGGKAVLAASVDAGPAAKNRTVTWSSSDATVATVGTDGTVTGVKAGTVSIIAASVQDPTVR
ncbi:MAG: Ig-like domain-containing protein, partial [Gemmatimonadaceae bacterium]